ncbi:MAG: RloB family protein [Paludibacter sp.]
MRNSKSILKIGKPKFAFVGDGECEYWYIQMLKRNERAINVDFKPELLQKKKLIDQYKKVIELSNDYDKVFWVVDFDTLVKETREAKKGTKTAIQEFKEYCDKISGGYENIEIVVNNPCLEYWILLHYERTSKYYETGDRVGKQLKKYLPEYNKSQSFYTKQDSDIYLRLKPLLSNAISNAEKLGRFDFYNPETGMSEMQLIFNTKQIKKGIEVK